MDLAEQTSSEQRLVVLHPWDAELSAQLESAGLRCLSLEENPQTEEFSSCTLVLTGETENTAEIVRDFRSKDARVVCLRALVRVWGDCADAVCEREGLAERIRSFRRLPEDGPDHEQLEKSLGQVCDLVKRATGRDLGHYRRGVLVRRLRRRIGMTGCQSTGDYLELLRNSHREAVEFVKDVLINVTSFFRDREVFAQLEERLEELLHQRPKLRIWSAGCATGEEAYSLAILVRECQERLELEGERARIFATDLDAEALEIARSGFYKEVDERAIGRKLLEKYFLPEAEGFRVKREVREMCQFSQHSLINDPPFTDLDLICCRNVLIYLGTPLQEKLIPMFHYGLRKNGLLVLGSSETVGDDDVLFQPCDERSRIFRRVDGEPARAWLPSSPHLSGVKSDNQPPPYQEVVERILRDEFTPRACVVNEEGRFLWASDDLGDFLSLSKGDFRNNVVRLARHGIKGELRAALLEARRSRRISSRRHLPVKDEKSGLTNRVDLTVQPMPQLGFGESLFLIIFQDRPDTSRADEVDLARDTPVERLEQELGRVRAELERTVQDLESTNEELKSSNEELQAINEELRLTNQELESARDRAEEKSRALRAANNDLEHLLTSTHVPIIFVDREHRILRFTPSARRVYHFQDSDLGRPLWEVAHKACTMPELPPEAEDVKRPVELTDGSFLIRSTRPYSNSDGEVTGMVVIFTDVTEIRHHEAVLKQRVALLEASQDFVALADQDGTIDYLNAAALQYLGAANQACSVQEVFADQELCRQALDRAAQGRRWSDEVALRRNDGALAHFWMDVFPCEDDGGDRLTLGLVGRNLKDIKKAEKAVSESQRKLQGTLDLVTLGYVSLGREWECRVMNRAAAELLDCSREQALGAPLSSLWPQTHWEKMESFLGLVLNEGSAEREFCWGDNAVVVQVRGFATEYGLALLLEDISEQHELKERLRRMAALVETSKDFIGVCDKNLNAVYINKAGREMTGRSPGEAIELFHPEWAFQRLKKAIETHDSTTGWRGESALLGPDGKEIPVSQSMFPLHNEDGTLTGFATIARDIRELKERERESARREKQFRDTLLNAPIPILLFSKEGRIKAVSENLTAITGYRLEEIERLESWLLIAHREQAQSVEQKMRDMLSGQTPRVAFEAPVYTKQGERRYWCFVGAREAVGENEEQFVLMASDLTDRRDQEEVLRSAAVFLRNVLDSLEVFVAVLSPDGTLQEVNSAALRVAGLQDQDVLGRPFWETYWWSFDPACQERLKASIQEAAAGRPVRYDTEVRVKQGSLITIDFHIVPMRDEHGVITHLIPSGSDVTERRRIERELQASARKLDAALEASRAASVAKSEFLANMSHEIRTPMSAILGYVDILVRHVEDPDDLECLRIIERNGQHLVRLINDILDLTKIEAGRLELETKPVQVPQLISEVMSLMIVRAEEKDLELESVFETPVPELIESDSTRLLQVLVNLVGNAVKFTQSGKVKLSVARVGEQCLQFSVQDTGPGIPDEKLEQIMEPFHQADSSVTRRYGGTGLGLSICRRLVEMLGGELKVDSRLGVGSEFRFTVSTGSLEKVTLIQPEMTGKLTYKKAEVALPDLGGTRVLVVDDRRDIGALAVHYLEEAGAEATYARDGLKALELIGAQDQPFHVVVMDMQMPVMDGYEAARKARQAGYEIPILALTASAMKGDRERCLAAGCTAYLSKPVDRVGLVNQVHRLKAGRASVVAMVVEDSKMAAMAVSSMLRGAGCAVLQAASGEEALQVFGQHHPDLILLDLGLPDFEPDELLSRLRQMDKEGRTRIFAHTGRARDEVGEGFDGYIQKPAARSELERLVYSLVNFG